MKNEGSETDIELLLEREIVEVPVVLAEVFLPREELPSKEDIQLMHKILLAMGLGSGTTWFRYYGTLEEVKTKHTKGILSMAFKPNSNAEGELEVDETAEDGLLKLPSLRQIGSEDAVKRDVWRAIKPFSVR